MKFVSMMGSAGIVVMALAASTTAAESLGARLSKAVKDGEASLDFRYRFETVDQDGFDKDAEASLLRSRLTFSTAAVNGFKFQFEADNVTSIGPNDYNSTENGKTEYPVIADPEGTEVNQAWLSYRAGSLDSRFGRQRIVQGNQRFVGGVAWRQNEQTYDGARLQWSASDTFNLDVSYVYNINRIFGPDDGANPADWEGDNVFARATWSPTKDHSLVGFGILVDVEEQGAYGSGATVDNSSQTIGIEYSGKFGRLAVDAAWATQSDTGDSTLDYDADYYRLELTGDLGALKASAGYEVLGSDNGVGFRTPLATLHKFQGWADKFLATPGDGIEDAYLSLAGSLGPVKLAAVYHDFQAESSSADFGTEFDLVATWPVSKQFTVQAKFAAFDSDDRSRYTDTDKAWLTLQLKL